jgi:hypothetical protein
MRLRNLLKSLNRTLKTENFFAVLGRFSVAILGSRFCHAVIIQNRAHDIKKIFLFIEKTIRPTASPPIFPTRRGYVVN